MAVITSSAAQSHSRRGVVFRLLPGGRAVWGLSVILYLSSLTSQSGLLVLLASILASLVVANAWSAWQSIRRVSVLPPTQVHAVEGRVLTESWTVVNESRSVAQGVEVVGPGGSWLKVPVVQPSERAAVRPVLVAPGRGVHPMSDLMICSGAPFSLITASKPANLRGEMLVLPALFPIEAPPASGFEPMVGGKLKGQRRSLSGGDFAGVRPLQPGDPLRQIHWKASSKGLGLMVKTFEEEVAGRVAVITDGGGGGGVDAWDETLRLAGSLMFATLDAGHHLEWIDLGERQHRVFPPFADGGMILELLARLPAPGPRRDAQDWVEAIGKCSSRCGLALVTTGTPSPSLVEAIESGFGQGNRPLRWYEITASDDPPAVEPDRAGREPGRV